MRYIRSEFTPAFRANFSLRFLIHVKICVPLAQEKKFLLSILHKTVDNASLNEQHYKGYYRTADLP